MIPPPRPRLQPAGRALPEITSQPRPGDPAELGHPLLQSLPAGGEAAAHQLLDAFLSGPVFDYAAKRDFPARQGTSQLSPHLRCGTIGIRTVLAGLKRARAGADAAGIQGCETFLNELVWREFYLQVLANFPQVSRGCFRPEYDALRWSDNRAHFEAWCAGMTGYPIVDAAMRCLNATGCMHNRLRMVTAMFLTKDLLVNWQWGERYFMQKLVDGDLAANNGGWQWSAGTGTDAAPYFRIFNPGSQGRKFDPAGEFIRRWVPELAGLDSQVIHEPESAGVFGAAGRYPLPIVDHAEQRVKCLAMFQAVRKSGPPA